ncbi:MAG: STAS-like domain-containing protein [Deltaproteobacteria bacterium]|nr:STAS-like domain-containing protein [Deltaproteobacteria bacterium]
MGATTLSVYEIVGNSLCVASDDGRKVYDQIVAALRVGRKITLSFHDVTFLTAAFLHTAFGQLYGSFLEEDIRSNIQLTDIEPDDLILLERVVDSAKACLEDPGRFKETIRNVLEEEDDF